MTEEYEDTDELELEDEEQPGGNEMYEHYRIEADRGQIPLRIDKFLMTRLPNASRTKIQEAADAGNIRANEKAVKPNYKVKPGDVISVVMSYPKRDFEIIPENIPLNIVYEDEHLLVVNKEAGMVVHPAFGHFNGTLVHALAWHLKDNPLFQGNDFRPGLVHRIDKDTSGLLVVAKTPDAKTALGKQFFNKTTKREYIAVVWGIPSPDTGTIVGNIARNPKDRLQMAVFPAGGEIGKHAVTHYEVVEKLNYVSVVKCVLETGRTHQIRVHMMHSGHPLLNDARYGGDEILRGTTSAKYRQFVKNCFDTCPRQALHARTLGFVHPATRREMFFTSPIPADMEAMIDRWRKASFT